MGSGIKLGSAVSMASALPPSCVISLTLNQGSHWYLVVSGGARAPFLRLCGLSVVLIP